MIMEEAYKKGDTIYLLMDAKSARGLMDDWAEHNYECDLVVHRSQKNRGCVVVETRDLLWARRIMLWHQVKRVTCTTKTTK